jgi:hypothetical protein
MILALIPWGYPLPVQAHVQETNKTNQRVDRVEERPLDSSGVLRIHAENIQPRDNKPVQKAKPTTDPIRARPTNRPNPKGNTETSGRSYSKEEVIQLINDYSKLYGISPETPLCIARLESGYNQFSKNKSSSASGVFQYLSGTWRGTDEGRSGLSVFDAEANVKAAIKYMAIHKSTKPWTVAPKCPKLKFISN